MGRYKIEARAGLQKNLCELSRRQYTRVRIAENLSQWQKVDQTCNGTFVLNSTLFWDEVVVTAGKLFKGTFTCPDNRSRTVDFNVNFANKTTEDLAQGTNVIVSSSVAPGMRF